MFAYSPLEQFCVSTLIPIHFLGYNLSITNATLFLFLVFTILYLTLTFATMNATVVPNNWQLVVENIYSLTKGIVESQIGVKHREYFPFIFVLFCFVLFSNLCGMVPYTFTVTSHIFITFSLGMMMFVCINVVGFSTHGLHYFSLLVPPGLPSALVPLLIGIELVSYIFRVISISVRLFANLMAGHALLKILAGFAWAMLSAGVLGLFGSFLTLSVVLAVTGLEVGIAMLQAYVFAVLTCLYLSDAVHLH